MGWLAFLSPQNSIKVLKAEVFTGAAQPTVTKHWMKALRTNV